MSPPNPSGNTLASPTPSPDPTLLKRTLSPPLSTNESIALKSTSPTPSHETPNNHHYNSIWIEGSVAGLSSCPILVDPKSARSRVSYGFAERAGVPIHIHSIPKERVKVLIAHDLHVVIAGRTTLQTALVVPDTIESADVVLGAPFVSTVHLRRCSTDPDNVVVIDSAEGRTKVRTIPPPEHIAVSQHGQAGNQHHHHQLTTLEDIMRAAAIGPILTRGSGVGVNSGHHVAGTPAGAANGNVNSLIKKSMLPRAATATTTTTTTTTSTSTSVNGTSTNGNSSVSGVHRRVRTLSDSIEDGVLRSQSQSDHGSSSLATAPATATTTTTTIPLSSPALTARSFSSPHSSIVSDVSSKGGHPMDSHAAPSQENHVTNSTATVMTRSASSNGRMSAGGDCEINSSSSTNATVNGGAGLAPPRRGLNRENSPSIQSLRDRTASISPVRGLISPPKSGSSTGSNGGGSGNGSGGNRRDGLVFGTAPRSWLAVSAPANAGNGDMADIPWEGEPDSSETLTTGKDEEAHRLSGRESALSDYIDNLDEENDSDDDVGMDHHVNSHSHSRYQYSSSVHDHDHEHDHGDGQYQGKRRNSKPRNSTDLWSSVWSQRPVIANPSSILQVAPSFTADSIYAGSSSSFDMQKQQRNSGGSSASSNNGRTTSGAQDPSVQGYWNHANGYSQNSLGGYSNNHHYHQNNSSHSQGVSMSRTHSTPTPSSSISSLTASPYTPQSYTNLQSYQSASASMGLVKQSSSSNNSNNSNSNHNGFPSLSRSASFKSSSSINRLSSLSSRFSLVASSPSPPPQAPPSLTSVSPTPVHRDGGSGSGSGSGSGNSYLQYTLESSPSSERGSFDVSRHHHHHGQHHHHGPHGQSYPSAYLQGLVGGHGHGQSQQQHVQQQSQQQQQGSGGNGGNGLRGLVGFKRLGSRN
ncbi:hypothetical protein HDU76_001810 [Blyttiomyces sp. JEL0837]|nr:hypothetical protein HDU76_001810 [Blyttiomyces sp. JEL0837]